MMWSSFAVLLSLWLCLLPRTGGLSSADCDSAAEGLLLLEDAQSTINALPFGQNVVLEGFVKDVYAPQFFYIQSADGAVEVSVFSPWPIDMVAQEGERVRVAGAMLPTGSTPTLMLPFGSEVEASVVLCSEKTHARRLMEEGNRGWADIRELPPDPCIACNVRDWYNP